MDMDLFQSTFYGYQNVLWNEYYVLINIKFLTNIPLQESITPDII